MDEFEFLAWCTENELENETIELLVKKGFKSYKSISRLNEETLKREFSKHITPGQYMLLQGGVETVRPHPIVDTETTGPQTPQHQQNAASDTLSPNTLPQQPPLPGQQPPPPGPQIPPATQQLSASDLLAMWHTAGQLQPATAILEGKADDPFGFGTGPHGGSKCRQIGEYITHIFSTDADFDQDTTVNLGGVEFSLAKGKKVPQDKIRIQHFMEGSLRILREMIIDDSMPSIQIINHINYLIQIACLSQTNAWKKVKDYDTIYRREQHKHGFAWGKNSAFLLQSQLGSAESAPYQAKKGNATFTKRPPLPSVRNPSTGQTICNNYNGRNGCSFPTCHFAHVCKTCFSSAHNEVQHKEKGLSAQPTQNQSN